MDFNRNNKNDLSEAKQAIINRINALRAKRQPARPVKITRQVDTAPIEARVQAYRAKPVIDTSFVTNRLAAYQQEKFVPDFSRGYQNNVVEPAKQKADAWMSKIKTGLGIGADVGRAGLKIGDTVLDYTLRAGVTRPAAQAILTLADAIDLKPIAGPNKGQEINTIPINDITGRLLFGKDDLKSYQQQTRDAQGFLENDLGMPSKYAMPVGFAAGTVNALLDLPGGSLAKKPVKEVAEAGLKKFGKEIIEEVSEKEIKNLSELAVKKTVDASKDPDVQKRLWGLMNYQNILKKAGYTEEQLSKISAKEGIKIIENKFPHVMPKFTGTAKSLDNAFADWVNARRTTELAGINAKKAFQKFDAEGLQGIFKAQAGKIPEVREYFDDIYKKLSAMGVDFNYKKNYLPQLWRNTEDEVQQAFKGLSKNAPFTRESVLKNYKEGLAAKLTPRFSKVSDLVGWYQKSAEKMIADRNFLDYLEAKDLIKVGKDVEPGWMRITAQGFPTKKVKEGQEVVEYLYSAPPELAKKINQYLSGASIDALEKTGSYASAVKNMKLAGGIPGTGLNAHGWNIATRAVLSRNNPISGLWDASKWILNPRGAGAFVESSLKRAEKYSRYGLTLTTEDFAFTPDPKILTGNILQKSYQVLGNSFDKYLGDPLFRNIIPALKIRLADEVVQGYLKSGIDEDTALREASKVVNNIFGGINYDQIARNKDMQNLFRSVILAPDWAESTVRTGAGIVKGLTTQIRNPLYAPYRIFARNFVAMMIAKSALEFAINGKANQEGLFNLDTGTYTGDGKKRVIRVGGTGADMFRIPYETVAAMTRGDMGAVGRIVTNRLSLPASATLHLATNENYYGQPLMGKDKYGNEIPLSQSVSGVASEVSSLMGIPNQVGITGNLLTGAISPEEALMQATETPIRYRGGPSQYETSKKNYETYKTAGLEGEDLYNAMESQKKKTTEPSWLQQLFQSKPTPEVIPSDPLLAAVYLDEQSKKKKERIREVFKLGLTPMQIQEVLEKEGLGSYQEASLVMIEGLGVENGQRPNYLKSVLVPLEGTPEFEDMALYYARQGLLTDSVIKYWQSEGMSENSLKYLKALVKEAKDSTTKTGSRKKPKIEAPSLSKFQVQVPKPKDLNISIPKLRPVKPLEVETTSTKRLSRELAAFEDEIDKLLEKR